MLNRKSSLFTVILVILVLAVAVPVLAKSNDPVGTQIDILRGPEDVEVSGPFHVQHGVGLEPSEAKAIGKFEFVLEIDGVKQQGQLVSFKSGDVLVHLWLFNYPEGLAPGDYVFTGTFYGPCGFMPSGPCDQQNEVIERGSRDINVTVLP